MADQLSALASGAASDAERAELWRHLAECDGCREILFEVSAPAKRGGVVTAHLMAAAAMVLLFLSLGVLRVELRDAPASHSAQRTSLPAAFRSVSLMSIRTYNSMPPLLRMPNLLEDKPRANQFVLRTKAGERWISFESAKVFAIE